MAHEDLITVRKKRDILRQEYRKLRGEAEKAKLLDERIDSLRWMLAEQEAEMENEESFKDHVRARYAEITDYSDDEVVSALEESIGFDGILQELEYVTTQNKDGQNILYKQIANNFCLHVIGKSGKHLPVTYDEAIFQLYSTSRGVSLKVWSIPMIGNTLLSAIEQIEREAYEAIK